MTGAGGEPIRRHALVTGVVQGVGFRWFVERVARSRGLGGWVRNMPDGGVELEVEGPAGEVESFLDEVRVGPRSSRVDGVVVSDAKVQGTEDFSIRFG
jgi:acylphosphatase